MLLHISKGFFARLLELRKYVLFVVDSCVACLVFTRRKRSNVAIVRLDAIGDFVLWLDTAKEYSRIFPGKRIELIANSVWADLARELPYWSKVWSIDIGQLNRSPLYRWKTLRKIRQAGFKIAVQPTFSRVFLHGDSVIRASGAAQRIGSSGDLSNIRPGLKAISDRWYTALVPASQTALMELERNAEFLRNLTGQEFMAGLPKLPTLAALPEHLRLEEDYFIIFPGASWHGRQWPSGHFAQVLDQLHRRNGWRAVLCGSSSEWALCQSVVDISQATSVNLAGKTSLTELAELIRSSKLLISNETSAVHMAAAVGTPSVCILGGGHYGRFMPYPERVQGVKPKVAVHHMPCFNCNWSCRQVHDKSGPVPCISMVSVEQVLQLADEATRTT